MQRRREATVIDWSNCPDVERIPGKVSGAWLVVGTRIPAAAVIDNADDGYTAEEIVAEIYPSLPLDRARRIIAYAANSSLCAASCLTKAFQSVSVSIWRAAQFGPRPRPAGPE